MFVQKWDQSLRQIENNLLEADRPKLRSFQYSEDLMKDLRGQATAMEMTPLSHVLTEIVPALKIMSKVSELLLLAMRPNSIELTPLWGLLHLTIQVWPGFLSARKATYRKGLSLV
jgi:hypothetical protein